LAALLSVQTHNGGRRCQADTDLTMLVDQEAFGSDASDNIFGGQFRW
jgi:hypothetical protein